MIIPAVLLAFGPILLTQPTEAFWQSNNALVNQNSVQFTYIWGWAETPVTNGVTVTIDNTITNKIGWNGEVIDTFRVTFNDQTIELTEKGVFTYTFEGTGTLRLEGVDRGFWGGYYGPIATISDLAIQEPAPVVPAPEPSPEPLPSPEPSPSPVEPQPSPEPEPTYSPEPQPLPSPEPEPQPTPEPVAPVEPEPTDPPVVEPEPEPVQEEPTPEPSPTESPSPSPIPVEEPSASPEPTEETPQIPEAPEPEPLPEAEEISIAIIGEAIGELISSVTSAGLDMTPEQREEAQEVVVSTIIVSQVASAASVAVRKVK